MTLGAAAVSVEEELCVHCCNEFDWSKDEYSRLFCLYCLVGPLCGACRTDKHTDLCRVRLERLDAEAGIEGASTLGLSSKKVPVRNEALEGDDSGLAVECSNCGEQVWDAETCSACQVGPLCRVCYEVHCPGCRGKLEEKVRDAAMKLETEDAFWRRDPVTKKVIPRTNPLPLTATAKPGYGIHHVDLESSSEDDEAVTVQRLALRSSSDEDEASRLPLL